MRIHLEERWVFHKLYPDCLQLSSANIPEDKKQNIVAFVSFIRPEGDGAFIRYDTDNFAVRFIVTVSPARTVWFHAEIPRAKSADWPNLAAQLAPLVMVHKLKNPIRIWER